MKQAFELIDIGKLISLHDGFLECWFTRSRFLTEFVCRILLEESLASLVGEPDCSFRLVVLLIVVSAIYRSSRETGRGSKQLPNTRSSASNEKRR